MVNKRKEIRSFKFAPKEEDALLRLLDDETWLLRAAYKIGLIAIAQHTWLPRPLMEASEFHGPIRFNTQYTGNEDGDEGYDIKPLRLPTQDELDSLDRSMENAINRVSDKYRKAA